MTPPIVSADALRQAMREANVMGDVELPMADIAQFYARVGVPVFPVRPDTRQPYLPAPAPGKGGFHQRSADPETVKSRWQRYPDALVGIVPGDAGLVAADIDTEQAGQSAVARGLLDLASFSNGSKPTGLIVESGGESQPFKVGGIALPPMHQYFGAPAEAAAKQLRLRGVVIRYQAGYVVAPGSWRRVAQGTRHYRLLSDDPDGVYFMVCTYCLKGILSVSQKPDGGIQVCPGLCSGL